jgi:hypothetical protein
MTTTDIPCGPSRIEQSGTSENPRQVTRFFINTLFLFQKILLIKNPGTGRGGFPEVPRGWRQLYNWRTTLCKVWGKSKVSIFYMMTWGWYNVGMTLVYIWVDSDRCTWLRSCLRENQYLEYLTFRHSLIWLTHVLLPVELGSPQQKLSRTPSLNTQSCIKGLLVVRDFCFWVVWAAGPVLKKKVWADYE